MDRQRISTNYFSLPALEDHPGVYITFQGENSLQSEELVISISGFRVRAKLEAYKGTVADGIIDFFEEQAQAIVEEYFGYFADVDLNYPNDLNICWNDEDIQYFQSQLLRFGSNQITLVITTLDQNRGGIDSGIGYNDEYLTRLRRFLSEIALNELINPPGEVGELLPISFASGTPINSVGNIRILSPF
jgi:hypothetical protein